MAQARALTSEGACRAARKWVQNEEIGAKVAQTLLRCELSAAEERLTSTADVIAEHARDAAQESLMMQTALREARRVAEEAEAASVCARQLADATRAECEQVTEMSFERSAAQRRASDSRGTKRSQLSSLAG
eukprot:3201159-Pleurochrysis_carterae.AAC.1